MSASGLTCQVNHVVEPDSCELRKVKLVCAPPIAVFFSRDLVGPLSSQCRYVQLEMCPRTGAALDLFQ